MTIARSPEPARVRAFPAFPPRRLARPGRAGEGRPFPFADRPFGPPFGYRFARAAVWHGLRALGLRPGDEVLMPSFHHGVEVETVRALGARVRFFPVPPDLTIRLEDVGAALGPATRAVYVIHYFGFPQPVAGLLPLCRTRGMLLFEDCALSLLSAPDGVPLGSLGDAAAFCLYKTLPVPDGGLLVVDPRVRDRVPPPGRRALAGPAREAVRLVRGLVAPPPPGPRTVSREEGRDDAPVAGDPLRAGHPVLDRRQLELPISPVSRLVAAGLDLPEIRRRRRRNFAFWEEAVGRALPSVAGPLPPGACPLLYPFRADDKPGLCRAFAREGLELHQWWHRRAGGARAGECPEADALRRELVGLPVHQNLDERALERLRDALQRHGGS